MTTSAIPSVVLVPTLIISTVVALAAIVCNVVVVTIVLSSALTPCMFLLCVGRKGLAEAGQKDSVLFQCPLGQCKPKQKSSRRPWTTKVVVGAWF